MEVLETANLQLVKSKKGKRWNRLEERRLIRLFQSSDNYAEIAALMGRTTSAVTSRLQRLGYLRYDKATDSLIRIM